MSEDSFQLQIDDSLKSVKSVAAGAKIPEKHEEVEEPCPEKQAGGLI